MAIDICFYVNEAGHEPVRKWLKDLPKRERWIIGEDIRVVQLGWPIGKPLVDGLGYGLWEIRSRLDDRIARIIFCIEEGELVLLHGFIKKTQKTPPQELELARKRMKLNKMKRRLH